MSKIKVRVDQVCVIRDKLKTFHPYRPRALGAYVYPRIFSLVRISIFNLGRDGRTRARVEHIG